MSSAASTAAIAGHRGKGKDPHDWRDQLVALGILIVIASIVIGLIFLFA